MPLCHVNSIHTIPHIAATRSIGGVLYRRIDYRIRATAKLSLNQHRRSMVAAAKNIARCSVSSAQQRNVISGNMYGMA